MPKLKHRNSDVLINSIRSQIASLPDGMVELIIEEDNGELTSGQKRQILANRSKGIYRCYVDDDDQVSDEYVSSLLQGCNSGADVVTFRLEFSCPNLRTEVWQYGLYNDCRRIGLMAANHLCAWRGDIADKVPWHPDFGYGDDQLWYQPLHQLGLVKSTYQFTKVLYHYLYSPTTTINQADGKRENSLRYVTGQGIPYYLFQDCYCPVVNNSSLTPGQVSLVGPKGNIVLTQRSLLDQPAAIGFIR